MDQLGEQRLVRSKRNLHHGRPCSPLRSPDIQVQDAVGPLELTCGVGRFADLNEVRMRGRQCEWSVVMLNPNSQEYAQCR